MSTSGDTSENSLSFNRASGQGQVSTCSDWVMQGYLASISALRFGSTLKLSTILTGRGRLLLRVMILSKLEVAMASSVKGSMCITRVVRFWGRAEKRSPIELGCAHNAGDQVKESRASWNADGSHA